MQQVISMGLQGFRLSKWVFLLCVGLLLLGMFASVALAYDFGGGVYSVKVVDRSGIDGAPLVIGRSGVSDSSLLVGTAPLVSTLSPIGVEMDGGTKATLRGQVTDMRSFPSAVGYFEWGYNGNLSNSTGVQTVTGTGTYTAGIIGYDPVKDVEYRFVVEADGTSYGGVQSFQAQGAVVMGYRMLVILPFIWLGLCILVIWSMVALGYPLVLAAVFGAIVGILGGVGSAIILESLMGLW